MNKVARDRSWLYVCVRWVWTTRQMSRKKARSFNTDVVDFRRSLLPKRSSIRKCAQILSDKAKIMQITERWQKSNERKKVQKQGAERVRNKLKFLLSLSCLPLLCCAFSPSSSSSFINANKLRVLLSSVFSLLCYFLSSIDIFFSVTD